MFKNRLTLGYLVLVGVPLLFLAVTLRAGRGLSAPPAISGTWTIESQQALPRTMTIDQTGPDLLIAFHDPDRPQFAASLENGRISGPGFQAGVTGQPGKRWLEGRAPAAFRAVKSKAPEK